MRTCDEGPELDGNADQVLDLDSDTGCDFVEEEKKASTSSLFTTDVQDLGLV